MINEPGHIAQTLVSLGWLPAITCFATFVIVALIVRPLSARAAGPAATLGVSAAAVMSLAVGWAYIRIGNHEPFVAGSFEWLRFQSGLTVRNGALIDPISILLQVVVTFVSLLVHIYSLGYMRGDSGFGRYFTWLSLFTAAMMGLVVAPNLIQMYACWELVGVSSFLLIGFYYERPAAVAAAKKAFIVTRFADLGFLIGVLLLSFSAYEVVRHTGGAGLPKGMEPFDFLFLNDERTLAAFSHLSPVLGLSVLTLSTLLLFCGAAGKSAMFPLHVWLPDAMEGPTPVSALIHAATMVVAGVYLTARMFPMFLAADITLLVVAAVGTFTCLFAALIACVQNDIKRVLAYSTLSQIGYMILALGIATADRPLGYAASMFHLFTHAFFKALLFLGAGALIHAVHTNEITGMGRLARRMPITHMTFLIACLAIAGVWPLAGFHSKDEILLAAYQSNNLLVTGTGLLVAGLTAFYMFRVYFTVFWGEAGSEASSHAHDGPATMSVPLIVLALLSVVAGYIPVAAFVGHGESGSAGHHLIVVLSSVAAFAGITSAFVLYARPGRILVVPAGIVGWAYHVIRRKFFIDEVYLYLTKRIIFPLVAAPIGWFDRHAVDGTVNLVGGACRLSGSVLRRLQTGQVQTYGGSLVAGAVIIALLYWARVL